MAETDAFSTQDAIDTAQRQIDQQLATLLDIVNILRRRRNALSLVSRLPAEILCRIFEIARDQDETQYTNPQMCISISQVCSSWRNTAMQFQGMWNCIYEHYKPQWVGELLVRSGTAPLRVSLTGYKESVFPLVFANAGNQRFQELSLWDLSPLEFGTHCRSIFGGHAPLLETLLIAFDSNHKCIVHERLFSEGTPRLRSLTLRNCPLPWNSPMLKSPLTHLKLVFPSGAAATRTRITWTMSQVTAILETLPALHELELCNVLGPIEDSTTPVVLPQRNISLPYLKDLSITAGTFDQCTRLLDRLVLTPTPSIRLDGPFDESQSWTLQSFIDSLSYIGDMLHPQHSVDPGPLRRAYLGFNSSAHRCLVFAAWNVESTPDVYVKPVIELFLRGHAHDLRVVPALMAALPLGGVQEIMFSDDLPQGSVQALLPLEHVRQIHIKASDGSDILKWLAQKSVGALPQFPFPALSRLKISGCNTLHRGGVGSTFSLLQTALRRRHRHGHGIALLYLSACDVRENQLVKLGRFVGRVVCDVKLNYIVPGYHSDGDDDSAATED
ncbi:hypothetical protein FPV67DRAFT_1201988 [Lyophyllum atratum]|nr:hypothetical protein FPV67DRAFT_1201988 [Lyophyllum atratum]